MISNSMIGVEKCVSMYTKLHLFYFFACLFFHFKSTYVDLIVKMILLYIFTPYIYVDLTSFFFFFYLCSSWRLLKNN